MNNNPHRIVPKFRAHVLLASGTLGHQIKNGAGDQPQVERAIAEARRFGEQRDIVIRNASGAVVAHAEL